MIFQSQSQRFQEAEKFAYDIPDLPDSRLEGWDSITCVAFDVFRKAPNPHDLLVVERRGTFQIVVQMRDGW